MANWNLKEFYENEENWGKDLEELKSLVPELASYEGKLNDFNEF